MADWTRLTPDQFEEFCAFLLQSENYTNVTRIGGSGDRGRDVVAELVQHIMTGKSRMEKWVLQAKRYTAAPPTPVDLEQTMAWARAHQPFGIIVAFPHILSPATHDWLTETERTRDLRILCLDRDYLESFLDRSPLARHRFFGEPAPSLERTTAPAISQLVAEPLSSAQSSVTRVYTAGKMDSEAKRGGTAKWRRDVEEATEEEVGLEFTHPELVGCDHTGIAPAQTVEADRYMLATSHVVVGYLQEPEMPGTLIELMLALAGGKDVGIFVDHKLLHPGGPEVYEEIYHTKHGCDCMLSMEANDWINRTPFWFFLNFVTQAHPDAFVRLVETSEAAEEMGDFIGMMHAIRSADAVPRPLSSWF